MCTVVWEQSAATVFILYNYNMWLSFPNSLGLATFLKDLTTSVTLSCTLWRFIGSYSEQLKPQAITEHVLNQEQ